MSDDDSDDSQKTEDPTPKKLQEARKRGQVPNSKEASTWLMLFIGTIVIATFGPHLCSQLTILMVGMIDQSWQTSQVPGVGQIVQSIVIDVFALMGIPMVVFVITAIAGPLAQVGPMFSTEPITPKLDKLSPMAGFKRLFSGRSFFEFIKGLAKVTIIGTVCWKVLSPYEAALDHMVDLSIQEIMAELLTMFIKLMTAILTVLFLLAGADILFQRYSHYKMMRMSRQEIRDEYKQTEGDPHIKSKLRQMRMERARKRMMQSVPKATVVVTNPTHFAVALRYEPAEMDAPVCVAKGQDLIALRIRKIAEENDITIVENPPLARTLFAGLEIDEMVPPEHYKAVAEVISYVFRMKKRL